MDGLNPREGWGAQETSAVREPADGLEEQEEPTPPSTSRQLDAMAPAFPIPKDEGWNAGMLTLAAVVSSATVCLLGALAFL